MSRCVTQTPPVHRLRRPISAAFGEHPPTAATVAGSQHAPIDTFPGSFFPPTQSPHRLPSGQRRRSEPKPRPPDRGPPTVSYPSPPPVRFRPTRTPDRPPRPGPEWLEPRIHPKRNTRGDRGTRIIVSLSTSAAPSPYGAFFASRRCGRSNRPRSAPERVWARRALRSAQEGKPISGGG